LYTTELKENGDTKNKKDGSFVSIYYKIMMLTVKESARGRLMEAAIQFLWMMSLMDGVVEVTV
jgi:hypothetical protein